MARPFRPSPSPSRLTAPACQSPATSRPASPCDVGPSATGEARARGPAEACRRGTSPSTVSPSSARSPITPPTAIRGPTAHAPPDAGLAARTLEYLDAAQPLSPGCRRAMELVLRVGLEGIQWQKDFTCLHLAAKDGHKTMAEYLLQLRANPAALDNKKQTPLDYAAQNGHTEVCALLRQAGPSPPRAEGGVRTDKRPVQERKQAKDRPVSPATAEFRRQLAAMELPPDLRRVCENVADQGWDRIQWHGGYTALHLAAKVGNEAVVRFLLHSRATTVRTVQDKNQKRPIDYARANGHAHLLGMLTPAEGLPKPPSSPSTDGLRQQADHAQALQAEVAHLRGELQEACKLTKTQSMRLKEVEDKHSRQVMEMDRQISSLKDEVQTLRSLLQDHERRLSSLQDIGSPQGWPQRQPQAEQSRVDPTESIISSMVHIEHRRGKVASEEQDTRHRQPSIRTNPELALLPPVGTYEETKTIVHIPKQAGSSGADGIVRGPSDWTEDSSGNNNNAVENFWGPIVDASVVLDSAQIAHRVSAADDGDSSDGDELGPVIRVTTDPGKVEDRSSCFADLTDGMTWRK